MKKLVLCAAFLSVICLGSCSKKDEIQQIPDSNSTNVDENATSTENGGATSTEPTNDSDNSQATSPSSGSSEESAEQPAKK